MATTTAKAFLATFLANVTIFDTGQDNFFNSTEFKNSTSTDYNALLTVTVPIVMFASGVFGNLLALIVLGTSRKKHKKTVFYRLVGALACTDLFGIVSVSPITIVVYSQGRSWVGGTSLCHYSSFMMIFSGIATLLIVGAMALERFVAIIHPYAYETRFSIGKVKYIVLGIWGTSICIALLPMIGLGENVKQYPGTWCFFDYKSDKVTGKIFTYFYSTVGLAVIFLTAICNVAVMIVLVKMRQSAKDIKPSTLLNKPVNRLNSEVQMMILLGGIILVFATCYAPLMVRLVINQTGLEQDNHSADLWAIRMACINQILDPWVYILFRKELFRKIWSLVHCKLKTDDKQRTHYNFKKEFNRVNTSLPESNAVCVSKGETHCTKMHFPRCLQCCTPKKHLRKGSGKSLLVPLTSYCSKTRGNVSNNSEVKELQSDKKEGQYYEGEGHVRTPLNIPVAYP